MGYNAEAMIAPKEEIDGWEVGFDKADLVRGVEIWFFCQPADPVRTVALAAQVFNVSPEFLAAAIDEVANPFFFALPNDDPGARILDCDGI